MPSSPITQSQRGPALADLELVWRACAYPYADGRNGLDLPACDDGNDRAIAAAAAAVAAAEAAGDSEGATVATTATAATTAAAAAGFSDPYGGCGDALVPLLVSYFLQFGDRACFL
jgi:hypothetical protein